MALSGWHLILTLCRCFMWALGSALSRSREIGGEGILIDQPVMPQFDAFNETSEEKAMDMLSAETGQFTGLRRRHERALTMYSL